MQHGRGGDDWCALNNEQPFIPKRDVLAEFTREEQKFTTALTP